MELISETGAISACSKGWSEVLVFALREKLAALRGGML
jgi:hypothetical protein